MINLAFMTVGQIRVYFNVFYGCPKVHAELKGVHSDGFGRDAPKWGLDRRLVTTE